MPVIGLHVCGNCLLESDMKALVGAALIALLATSSAHADRKIHLMEVYLHDCQIPGKSCISLQAERMVYATVC
jgi:hypothetical protein